MLVTHIQPVPVRCHHDRSRPNCTHSDGDGCSNFTIPCLTWSKIGEYWSLRLTLSTISKLLPNSFRSCPSFGFHSEGQEHPQYGCGFQRSVIQVRKLIINIFIKLISIASRTINSDEYDGSIDDYDHYLSTAKPLGWNGERAKLQSMTSASGLSGIIKCVKIRAFNPTTVVPSLVKEHDYLIKYFQCWLWIISFRRFCSWGQTHWRETRRRSMSP